MATHSGRLQPLAAILITAVLAIVIFGCGGSGGGGSTSSTASNGTTGVGTETDILVVALFSGTQSPASPFVIQNPPTLNFQLVPGDVSQVEVTGVNSITQQTSVLPATNFSIDAPSTVATISSSGVLTAKGSSPSTVYHVSATYSGTVYTSDFQVINPSAKVAGNVTDTSGNEVPGMVVDFYNSSGVLVAQTEVGSDGSFIANVPSTATSFALDSTTLSQNGYYTEYELNNFYYSATSQSCYTSLGTLTVGKKTTLASAIQVLPVNSGEPPPPPTGCSS